MTRNNDKLASALFKPNIMTFN